VDIRDLFSAGKLPESQTATLNGFGAALVARITTAGRRPA